MKSRFYDSKLPTLVHAVVGLMAAVLTVQADPPLPEAGLDKADYAGGASISFQPGVQPGIRETTTDFKPGPLPSSRWQSRDIGAVGAAGSFNLAGSVFTVAGAGADIWNKADAFHFVCQFLPGDCSITARVLNLRNTAGWAKAGVMIRETLDPDAQYVINFLSPENGVALQCRNGPAADASGLTVNPELSAPGWLRLVRAGNVFTAFASVDGVTWTRTGTTSIAMSSNVYVGLAVCSVANETLCQARFDNVSYSSVVAMAAPSGLIHRYSFGETSGTTAHDSVGGADGTLQGSAHFDHHGHVMLDGTSGCYVSLPGQLLAGLTNVTIEAWVTNELAPDNMPLFSFDDGTQSGVGEGYLRYVLHDQNGDRTFLELASSAGSPLIATSPGLGGQSVHVTCVYNSGAGTAEVYINGVSEASQPVSVSLDNVSPKAASLGRSPWGDDPSLVGAFDEFRIYAKALLPADIVATQTAGPDALPETTVALTVTQGDGKLLFSWPATGGYALESAPEGGAVWTPPPSAPAGQVTLSNFSPALNFRLHK